MVTTSSPSSSRARYALTLALGILVGVGASAIIGGGSFGGAAVDGDDVAGSILPRHSLERLELIERVTVAAGELRGVVETRGGRGIVLMEVAIESDVHGEVTVDFDDQSLSPRGFNQEDATAGEIHFKQDRFHLQTTGANRYQMTFRKRENTKSDIRLRFAAGEEEELIAMAIDSSN